MTACLSRTLGTVLFVCMTASARAQSATPVAPTKKATVDKAGAVHHDPAERAFRTHCSRCHSAPESLSPSLTGTVVRHMRVRANLTAEEERLILHYFNP